MMNCLYEDEELLVVEKPAGVESQEAGTFSEDMVSNIRQYLCHRNEGSCGKVAYVGVVHRLDKPVRGVMVYGKTPKATAALSEQVKKKDEKGMVKEYYALVLPDEKGSDFLLKHPTGELRHDLLFLKKGNVSTVISQEEKGKLSQEQLKEVKEALLSYEVAETPFEGFARALSILERVLSAEEYEKLRLLKVRLHTGRHHQIRVQLASIGCPLIGDRKYNTLWDDKGPGMRMIPLCLCAYHLGFTHPVTGKRMDFELDH